MRKPWFCKSRDLSRRVRPAIWPGNGWLILLCGIVLLTVPAVWRSAAQSQPGMPLSEKPLPVPPVNPTPDANDQMRMREEAAKKQNFEAANQERKKQLAQDAALLLKLANELKAEVDKTDKDTLSLTVIRKAESIERLAHGMKEKMKLTAGAS